MQRTDAHALFELLSELRDTGAAAISHGWQQVLGADYGTATFVKRHCEAVSLLTETIQQIAVLPSEATRARFQPYTHYWWRAVVGSEWNWQTQQQPASVISDEHLHLLGSAADVIEARLEKTPLAPGSFDLDGVRDECRLWIDALNDETGLPEALRLSLLQDLDHLTWLIDNVERFGVARVARAGQTAIGGLALAAPHVPEAQRNDWKKRMGSFAGSLVVLTGLFTTSTTAIQAGRGTAKEIAAVVADVSDAFSDPGSDEPADKTG